MTTLYYEDVSVGDSFDLGSYTVSEDEIISFATEYDPQPFHIDPDAARESPFNGIIASGWHTISITNRLVVDGFLNMIANQGGLGAESISWSAPVRPGDTITATLEVLEKRVSESNPSVGILRTEKRAVTQDDTEVLTYKTANLIARKETE
jgi:acyl dehydratase